LGAAFAFAVSFGALAGFAATEGVPPAAAGRASGRPLAFFRETAITAFFRPSPKIPLEPVETMAISSCSLATFKASQALLMASSTSVPLYSILADIVRILR